MRLRVHRLLAARACPPAGVLERPPDLQQQHQHDFFLRARTAAPGPPSQSIMGSAGRISSPQGLRRALHLRPVADG